MWSFSSVIETIQNLCCCGSRKNDNQEAKTDYENVVAKEFGILDMPEVVMRNICVYLDYKDIMALRKTCRPIRRYLTTQNSHQNLHTLHANFDRDINYLQFNWTMLIQYIHSHHGCIVRKGVENNVWRDKVLKAKFKKVFYGDLRLALVNLTSVMELLSMTVMAVYEKDFPVIISTIGDTLKSRRTLLKVKKLEIPAENQKQAMKMLPYIDPKYLKALKIQNLRGEDDSEFNMDNILKLELWKSLEEFELKGKVKKEHWIRFLEVPTACFEVFNIEMEDVLLMKKTCITIPTFREYRVDFHRVSHISNRINEQFGEPFFDPAQVPSRGGEWFFWIPGHHNDVIQMTLWAGQRYLTFKKIKWVAVSDAARIQE